VTRSLRWAAQADAWAAWADERHEDDVLPLFYDLLPGGALRALDDPALAVNEAGRILASGGRLCASIVHPIASAGSWVGDVFVIRDYPVARPHEERVGGLVFANMHYPLESWSRWLEEAGFVIERPPDRRPRSRAHVSAGVRLRRRRVRAEVVAEEQRVALVRAAGFTNVDVDAQFTLGLVEEARHLRRRARNSAIQASPRRPNQTGVSST
jgi:SAM-dependent methyltransferase